MCSGSIGSGSRGKKNDTSHSSPHPIVTCLTHAGEHSVHAWRQIPLAAALASSRA